MSIRRATANVAHVSRLASKSGLTFHSGNRACCIIRPAMITGLTLTEQRESAVFSKAMLRRNFGSKKESETVESGEQTELANTGDDLNSTSSSLKIPGTTARGGRQLAMVFTCTVCETRSVKQFTERSYTSGVVMVQCGGCQNWHVLADNLGYFGDDHFEVESLQNLPTVQSTDGVLEVDLEALLGKDKVEELQKGSSTDESQAPQESTKEDASK